jgi:hypothetical protein
MDVTGECRLRHSLSVTREHTPQVFLAGNTAVFRELQNQLLPRELRHDV